MSYYCYLIYSKSTNRTYIGITNDIDKRVRQHNGELVGGAKATKGVTDWMYYTFVGFFENKSKAMRFEWLWKHAKSKNGRWHQTIGLKKRLERLNYLLDNEEWHDIIILEN